jgi:hypothetical protein
MGEETSRLVRSTISAWIWLWAAGASANHTEPIDQLSAPVYSTELAIRAPQQSPPQQNAAAQAAAADIKVCSELCPTYAARVRAAQALDTVAENFFILWNRIGTNPDFGAPELKARSTVPTLDNTDNSPSPSLEDIVQRWAQNRFGSRGVGTLAQALGPYSIDYHPAFRSSIHALTATVDAACPFGDLGALGLKICPNCVAGAGISPSAMSSLISCSAAYAHNGDTVQGVLMGSGRYQRQLQANYCAAEDLFAQVGQWKASVTADLRHQASGSLAAILMFQNAIEGDTPTLDPDSSDVAEQTFGLWIPFFGTLLQNAPSDALLDLDSCSD